VLSWLALLARSDTAKDDRAILRAVAAGRAELRLGTVRV
jgi:hypothetical protein